VVRGRLVEHVRGHAVLLVEVWSQVMCLKMRGYLVGIPGNILMANLTCMDYIFMYSYVQPVTGWLGRTEDEVLIISFQ
jgi:hypothetical protein